MVGNVPPTRASTAKSSVTPFVLSETPAGTKSFPNGHYLVPDTNAFLNGMDLFELPTCFRDVIVLQTVLEEVKNRSLPLYHRLLSLTKNESKRFYVFFNDFRQETYALRDSGETINDRNDRAVRKAVRWYSEHLQKATKARKSTRCPSMVMISDDKENLRKAKTEDIAATSCAYCLRPCIFLSDLLLTLIQYLAMSRNSMMPADCLTC